MIILALDPSTSNVGYCLADGTEYKESGVYSPKGDINARAVQIDGWIKRKLKIYGPGAVVLEEPAGDHQNRDTDRKLAGISWIIRVAAFNAGATVAIVYPSQIKASGASKENTRYAAGVAGKVNVGPDEADAIGAWLAYLKGPSPKRRRRRRPKIIG